MVISNEDYRFDEIIAESLDYEQDNSRKEIMEQEKVELLDSMVDGFMQDIMYQFGLDYDSQALKLVRGSLDRLEASNDTDPEERIIELESQEENPNV